MSDRYKKKISEQLEKCHALAVWLMEDSLIPNLRVIIQYGFHDGSM